MVLCCKINLFLYLIIRIEFPPSIRVTFYARRIGIEFNFSNNNAKRNRSRCAARLHEKNRICYMERCVNMYHFVCRNYGWIPFDPFGRRLFLMNFRQVLLATQAAEYIV